MPIRAVKKIITGKIQFDGAGVRLVRVIGKANTENFDPFLLLDAFDSEDSADYIKGFPWHPHRGIETITYLIQGLIQHEDSTGKQGSITDGSCQWMTAGSGIMHQEMPQPVQRLLGIQLWLNLPRRSKMTKPAYRDIQPEMIPKIMNNEFTVGIISGQYKGVPGPVQGDYVTLLFLDVDMREDANFNFAANEETLFIYIVSGNGWFGMDNDGPAIPSKRAVLFEEGTEFMAKAGRSGLRFLLFAAKPLVEPVAWDGPIVMNTQQELDQAFDELRKDTFIKKE